MQSTGYFATIYRFGVLICGPKNRVFDIKSDHDFCRYRNSIQVIYFQINGIHRSKKDGDMSILPECIAGIKKEYVGKDDKKQSYWIEILTQV